MAEHKEAKDGLWVASDDDTFWTGGNGFWDTRQEAIASADPEHTIYVGQVTVLTDEEIVGAILRDEDEVDEQLRLQDEWSWAEDPILEKFSDSAVEELRSFVRYWINRHKINPRVWHVTSDEVKRTTSTNTSLNDPLQDSSQAIPLFDCAPEVIDVTTMTRLS